MVQYEASVRALPASQIVCSYVLARSKHRSSTWNVVTTCEQRLSGTQSSLLPECDHKVLLTLSSYRNVHLCSHYIRERYTKKNLLDVTIGQGIGPTSKTDVDVRVKWKVPVSVWNRTSSSSQTSVTLQNEIIRPVQPSSYQQSNDLFYTIHVPIEHSVVRARNSQYFKINV